MAFSNSATHFFTYTLTLTLPHTHVKVVTLGILCSRDRKAYFFSCVGILFDSGASVMCAVVYAHHTSNTICHKFRFDLVLKMDEFMKIVVW